MDYIHGAQKDLYIGLQLAEDLTGYTAVMHFRKDTLPVASETTVTATITVVTSILSYIAYTLTTASTILPAGDYNLLVDGELTNTVTTLSRRTSPAVMHVNKYGVIPYTTG